MLNRIIRTQVLFNCWVGGGLLSIDFLVFHNICFWSLLTFFSRRTFWLCVPKMSLIFPSAPFLWKLWWLEVFYVPKNLFIKSDLAIKFKSYIIRYCTVIWQLLSIPLISVSFCAWHKVQLYLSLLSLSSFGSIINNLVVFFSEKSIFPHSILIIS